MASQFEDWFYQVPDGLFCLRAEYFYDDVDQVENYATMRQWMADSFEAGVKSHQPIVHDRWIYEYPGEVFVVFDPTTDGANIIGAERTLEQARTLLKTTS